MLVLGTRNVYVFWSCRREMLLLIGLLERVVSLTGEHELQEGHDGVHLLLWCFK